MSDRGTPPGCGPNRWFGPGHGTGSPALTNSSMYGLTTSSLGATETQLNSAKLPITLAAS
jgi:hypothetical protein